LTRTFYLVTLGCPKNRVDAELIWADLAKRDLMAVDDPAQAEIIIVNSCAFIESAVSESVDTIIELGQYKKEGNCKYLVVAGCLTSRYYDQLPKTLPEVDLFVGPAEVGQLGDLLQQEQAASLLACKKESAFLPTGQQARVNSLSPGAAYLKVSEGCSRKCSFCMIPKIRGAQRSRPISDLVDEADNLVKMGIKEIILVAQDLISWGRDLSSKEELADLIQELAGISDLQWLRLMYLFPRKMPDKIIRVINDNHKVLNYLDLPFQHADDRILKSMQRGGDAQTQKDLVKRLRDELDDVVIRTTLMTGFPGEDESAYQRLKDFVEECRFERLGVFTYSAEEGSPAAEMANQVPRRIAEKRYQELLDIQQKIAGSYHQSLLDSTIEVLVEEEADLDKAIGRSWSQAPEVDGVTLIAGAATAGEIIKARVIKTGPYDLEVEPIGQ
jgi:ribosomal protein S12 methylthiotransferase